MWFPSRSSALALATPREIAAWQSNLIQQRLTAFSHTAMLVMIGSRVARTFSLG
jgi:hypothetical protein